MKKFSKIFCIIAAVAVMVACFAIPASAASLEAPEKLNLSLGDSLSPGWYYFYDVISSDLYLEMDFDFSVAGYDYHGGFIEFINEPSMSEMRFVNTSSIPIKVWDNNIFFYYPEARFIYINECFLYDEDEASFVNESLLYIGDSLEVPGAEPEGWYNNIYDLVVKHIFGGEMNLTPGMEFSASLVATVISIVAFLLPILICVFIIRFLFAWRI